jgi:(4-O-methyl)-D-glucuronate---lignin esterase
MKLDLRSVAALSLLMCVATARAASPSGGALEAGFENPPRAAKPRVWWHWMNGNVTQHGVTEDLTWMHHVGIAGADSIDGSIGTPQLVKTPLPYLSPGWKEAFRLAARLSAQYDMELQIDSAPGWSETGGPWVKPSQAMKKLVWSEMPVKGGGTVRLRLPAPPHTTGPFEDLPLPENPMAPSSAAPPPEFYRDVAVIAYRVPEAAFDLAKISPVVTTRSGPIDGKSLWDGNRIDTVAIPFAPAGQEAWVQYDLHSPHTVRSASIVLPSSHLRFGDQTQAIATLEASDDGTHFRKVVDFLQSQDLQQTLSFVPVTARYFRLYMAVPRKGNTVWARLDRTLPTENRLAEFVLYGAERVDRAEDKAAFFLTWSLSGSATPSAPADAVIGRDGIVDLTKDMHPDGTLDWKAPAGDWEILRFGFSLIGTTNHPASPEGTGLEVDKLSRTDVESYINHYLNIYSSFLPPNLMGKQGLHAMVNDSWEAGTQNWTDSLPADFARLRGYSLIPWLPALTGRVVGSPQLTDRFLWDFRRTLGELLAENHFHVIANAVHARGMIHYAESHEAGRAFIGDGMAVKRFADIPMSAMWAVGPPQANYDADDRESASVAHLYGRKLVAAESMTQLGDTFMSTPQFLRPTADREFDNGINRIVVHTSVEQPLDRPGPGITLGPFGQWFTRHETWAGEAEAWVSYLTRTSYLLQQGHFAADILYFYGQDSNITALYGEHLPPIPQGYAFDFADSNALELLSVRDGALTTRSGMRYRVLVLAPRTRLMSLDVLRRLHDLVLAGATLVGSKPQASPSLADSETAFHALADQMWGPGDTSGERTVGKGRIFAGLPLGDVLSRLGIVPDFEYDSANKGAHVEFVHRQLADGDVYFIDNREDQAEPITARFRVTGKEPQLWLADTGRIEPVSYRIESGHTTVPLTLAPHEAVFVVFRAPAAQQSVTVPAPVRTELTTLQGPWELRFPADGDGSSPFTQRLDRLVSWTTSKGPTMKYFSGTVSYLKSVAVPAAWLRSKRRIELDLGDVQDLADVRVNGKPMGVAWHPPFRLDITDALHPGTNRLEIRVVNVWVNRLIGDKQPGAKQHAYTTFDPYQANSPLLQSGLLGPVRLVSETGPAGSIQR